MCKNEMTGNGNSVCNCRTEANILLSRDELLKMMRQYKEHLEFELGVVNGKIKADDTPRKEVRKVAETKKDVEKSESGKATKEKSGCGCGCGCVPPPVKK